jgi:hypothetical protein
MVQSRTISGSLTWVKGTDYIGANLMERVWGGLNSTLALRALDDATFDVRY